MSIHVYVYRYNVHVQFLVQVPAQSGESANDIEDAEHYRLVNCSTHFNALLYCVCDHYYM